LRRLLLGLKAVTTFILGRAEPAVRGVSPPGVVEPLDVGEHLPLGIGPSREAGTVDQLGLQGREEALGDGVVIARSGPPGRGTDPRFLTAIPEGQTGVLRPLVGVVNQSWAG